MAKRCRESGPSSSAAAGRGAVRAAAAAKTTPAALPNGDANPTAHGLPSPSPRSSFLPRLPSDLINSVLALLSPNDLACNGRLAFKDAAQRFRLPRHRTVALGQTMSDHTAQQWQQHAAPRLKHLTLGAKLQLLSTAAATGCTANLSAVWALLRPCLFPELLPTKHALSYHYVPHYLGDDPGTAAVAAGHVQVLPWLVAHRVPLDPRRTLAAVAQHCDLRALQAAWQLLETRAYPGGMPHLLCTHGALEHRAVEAAAEASPPAPDARAKLEWLLAAGDSPDLLVRAAEGAARAGNMGLLQWLVRERGCPITQPADVAGALAVLSAALRHAELAVARWLVEEAGCYIPPGAAGGGEGAGGEGGGAQGEEVAGGAGQHYPLYTAAAGAASGGVEKLRWLAARGVAVQGEALFHAALAGRVDTLEYLVDECGLELHEGIFTTAARSGCVEAAAWLRGKGCRMDSLAYRGAARKGDVGMLVWLAKEARCPWGQDTLANVLTAWPHSPAQQGQQGQQGREACGGGEPCAGGSGYVEGMAVGEEGSGGEGGGSSRGGGGEGGGGGACGGNRVLLGAVRMLLEAGCPPGGTLALDWACWRGDLPLARYLHLHASHSTGNGRGAGSMEATAAEAGGAAAAEGGSGENGDGGAGGACSCCPMGHNTLRWAALSGCVALLEWLVGAGCPLWDSWMHDPHAQAAARGDLSTLVALRRLAVPYNAHTVMSAVFRMCPLPALKWLLEQGAPEDASAVSRALQQAESRSACGGGGGFSGVTGAFRGAAAWLKARCLAGGGAQGLGRGRGRGGARGRGAGRRGRGPGEESDGEAE